MRVVMLSSEAHPWAKTGGLADVLGALPAALAAAGIEVTVVLPGHRAALERAGADRLEKLGRVWAPLSSRMEPVDVLRVRDAAVPTILLASTRYFDRPALYGTRAGDYPDNAERFAVFCRAALEWLRSWPAPPHVVHAHDWQAGLGPAFLRGSADLYPELRHVRVMQTIHNLAYQGRFWAADWHLLNLDPRWFAADWLEFWGDINCLKAGIVFADAITTVSPRYAREIQTPELGEGLDGVLRRRADRLHGILNGIDVHAWDPATDPALPANYGPGRLGGKAVCKRSLQIELGLEASAKAPLLVVITRLAAQKGVDLLLAALPEVLATTDVQLAVLGSGEPHLEAELAALVTRLPGRVALRLGFDEALAHRMQGGADCVVMPSRYEPCGLAQMYGMRYGTVPVVHATGGLADTVSEWDAARGTGTGFAFQRFTAAELAAAIGRAVTALGDRAAWARLQANGMALDFSWERSAQAYRDLYATILASPVQPVAP